MATVIARFSGTVTFQDGSTETFLSVLDNRGNIATNIPGSNANPVAQVNADQPWIGQLMALLENQIPQLDCLGRIDKTVTDMVAELSGRVTSDSNARGESVSEFLIQFDQQRGAFFPNGGGNEGWLPALAAKLGDITNMFLEICAEATIGVVEEDPEEAAQGILDGATVYYDARVASSLVLASSSVTSWEDLIGTLAGADLFAGGFPPVVGKKPIFIASEIGGQPVISFDGINDNLTSFSSQSFYTGNLTIVAVVKDLDTTLDLDRIFVQEDGKLIRREAGKITLQTSDRAWEFASKTPPNLSIMIAQHNTGILVNSFWINGGTPSSELSLNNLATSGVGSPARLTLGAGNFAGTVSTTIKLGLFALFDSVLSISQIRQLLSGLSSAYGIPVTTAQAVTLAQPADTATFVFRTNVDAGNIVRMAPDGSGQLTIISGISPSSIAVNPSNSKIYYADGGAIKTANFDGSGIATLLSGEVPDGGIALDLVNGKIYWTERTSGFRVRRANLSDGSSKETLITESEALGQIGVDNVVEDKIYFVKGAFTVSTLGNVIRKANLDGSSAVDFDATGARVRGLYVNTRDQHVYWGDSVAVFATGFDGVRLVPGRIPGFDRPGMLAADLSGSRLYVGFTGGPDASSRAGVKRMRFNGASTIDEIITDDASSTSTIKTYGVAVV